MKKLMTVVVITLVLGAVVLGVTSPVLAKGNGPQGGGGTGTGVCTGTGDCTGTGTGVCTGDCTSDGNAYGYQGAGGTPMTNQNGYQYSNQIGDCANGETVCTRDMTQAGLQQGPFGGQAGQNGTPAAGFLGLVAKEDWVPASATVQLVEDNLVEVLLSDGTVATIGGRQLDYLTDAGIVLEVGDALDLLGFVDAKGNFAIGELTVDGETIALREDSGIPTWIGAFFRRFGGRK